MDDHVARILSLLSHELRSPLGVIRGYLGFLNQSGDNLSEVQRQAVAAALRASDRAAELLTQASMLAQLRRDGSIIRVEEIAIDRLLSAAIVGVTLAVDPPVRLERGSIPSVTIRADLPRLRDALTSLASAVVRAQTRGGHVLVTGDLHDRDETQGVRIRIVSAAAVSDSNEAPLDVSRGGLGLDLPIADYVIAAHGGDLRELRDGERAAGMVVWLPIAS